MSVFTIEKRGKKSSPSAASGRKKTQNFDDLMEEVDGPVDLAVKEAAYEAVRDHARAGRSIPVMIGDKVGWKPAAEVLAELETLRAARRARNSKRRPARKSRLTSK